MPEAQELRTRWTFLTQHARVLLMISRDQDVRLRDLAAACGLTERAVQAVVADLETAGYVTRTRKGRRNHYNVVDGTPFRHPAEANHPVGALLDLFADLDSGPTTATANGDHDDQHP
ncbi:helix-turn-helix domain-containing protein [Kitasatospora sp. MMS16-BH015]|uniref:helix-turn-helix transcriptional regulator n=1 Tax=Kitasatospora sp. MMS16-BH015 TaxID=2018025 RepID=UPI000CF20037|nr:helix-turn-helix domain-containing protein [Kitasatospora sp. MMS16-BH015]